MVSPELTTRGDEEYQATYWPAGVAIGAVVLVTGASLHSILITLIGFLIGLASGVLWVRETIHENQGMSQPIDARETASPDWAAVPSLYWWGGAGWAFLALMFHVAGLRVMHAHGLLSGGAPGVAAEAGFGLVTVATLVLLGSAGSAWWAARAANTVAQPRLVTALLTTITLGLAFVVLVIVDLARLANEGFGPTTSGAASAWYWVHGVQIAFMLAGFLGLGVLAYRGGRGQLEVVRWGAVHAGAFYWSAIAVLWLLVYVFGYLRVLTIGFHIIG